MQTCFEDIPHCEIFHPSLSEFQNFSEYLEKSANLAKSGIFKVVPPKCWKARKDEYKNLDFSIPHPIEQIVAGKEGLYELFLLQRESRSLLKYEKLVGSFDKITENKKPVEVEKLFWRTLKFSSPLYGADAPGSLFDKGVPWNLAEIESLLKKGLNGDITGVTTPYLYIGSWKSMFAWHKEDLDLYSINYLHFGKPKCWYSIPQEEEKQFQEFATKNFSDAARECPEFLRHKTYMINPRIIQENGLTVNKCIQYPGEFVITKCAGYHAGFNMGFNCAEAVNFALKNWVEFGKKAGYCKCNTDSVKIDIKVFSDNLRNYKTDDKLLKQKTKREDKIEKLRISNKNSYSKPSQHGYQQAQDNRRSNKNDLPSEPIDANSKLTAPKQKHISSISSKKQKDIDNWLSCDNCNKWRKIPKNVKYDPEMFINGFNCNFIKNLNCDSAEEKWRSQYTTLKRKSNIDNKTTKSKLKKYFKRMKESIKS